MKLTILLATSLSLASCATVLTPSRCAQINGATQTVQEIAAILVASGFEPVRAQKLAELAKVSQEAFRAACAAANPVGPAQP